MVVVIVGMIYNADRPHSKAIARATYSGTDPWPLTVDSGTLTCPSGIVLFTAGGIVYAQYPVPGDGHVDIDRITADMPGVQGQKMSVYSLFADGSVLC
ncbi:DUF2511 domain-containing protein [Catenulispora sp. GAS73]|uniref:DUF2511 domain-containing protein n=1 Tax=Catenulispora sp. GAS73 TaxID=3156269 RepID=UPI0035154D12